jgi:hypothetical protein
MNKIIDTHIHNDFSDELLNIGAKDSRVDYSKSGLEKEMKLNNVMHVVALQFYPATNNGTPIPNVNPIKNIKNSNNTCSIFAAINPQIKNDIKAYEKLVKSKKIMGFKIYLGYYHFYPYDEAYKPFFELAEKYNLIIMFHTGDNYSLKAKVKYAHPLNIDEIAVDYPKAKFIIAHMGCPWFYDAAEVVYKNPNVYADISGLMIGKLNNLENFNYKLIREALNYCGYDKILYGSDWPLAPMNKYIALVKKIVPKKEQKKVFYENAKKLFKIKK